VNALQISLPSMMHKVGENSEESGCEFVKIVDEFLFFILGLQIGDMIV
jgi:hypothetical protein